MLNRAELDLFMLQTQDILGYPEEERRRKLNEPFAKTNGLLPIHVAALAGNTAVMQKIIDGGADINALNGAGQSALLIALTAKNETLVETILLANPDLNKQLNANEQTLLHVLAKESDKFDSDQLQAVMTHGANVNAVDVLGKTPLHYATESGKTNMIALLLNTGARPDIEDKQGTTPFLSDKQLSMLHQGPRMKSTATKNLEKVMRAFATETPPAYQVNVLGEIEVQIEGVKYNLSKILEHNPDFEHINIRFPRDGIDAKDHEKHAAADAYDKNQEEIVTAIFKRLTEYRIQLNDKVPEDKRENMVIYEVTQFGGGGSRKGQLQLQADTKGLFCVPTDSYGMTIPWDKLPADFPKNFKNINEVIPYLSEITKQITSVDTSVLSEAEARAIRYFTMEKNSNTAYRRINQFMRENGKIEKLTDPAQADLRTILLVLNYLPAAMRKLQLQSESPEFQGVYRGETYDKANDAGMVMEKRLDNPVISAKGFISTSTSKEIADKFGGTDKSNINIIYAQPKNSLGIDITKYSENQHELEVLMAPGAQTIYRKASATGNTLLAIPVRSIDEIYSHNYDPEIIRLRGEMLDMGDKYSKDPAADPALGQIIKDICHNIAVYQPGEAVNSLQSCASNMAKLNGMHPINHEAEVMIDMLKKHILLIEDRLGEYLHHRIKQDQHALIEAGNYTFEKFYKNYYQDIALCDIDSMIKIDGDVVHRPKHFTNQEDWENYVANEWAAIPGVEIRRPNHSLAHDMRSALYVPPILTMLKNHAAHDGVKKYLSGMDDFKQTIIQIALLFSSTGREAEISAMDHMDVYVGYRKNGSDNFFNYLKQAGYYHDVPGDDLVKQEQNRFIDEMNEQLRYMGNPVYFRDLNALDSGNEEKGLLHLILILAHRLDLMRCFDLDKFKSVMNTMMTQMTGYVDKHFEIRALPVLYQMTNDALNTTGDRKYVAFQNGRLVDADVDYKTVFASASHDSVACIEHCFASNAVYLEVLDGKLNLDLPAKLNLSPLQRAIAEANSTYALHLMNDPESVSPDKQAFYQDLIHASLDEDDVILWEKINKTIIDRHDLSQADLVATLYFAIHMDKDDIALSILNTGVDLTGVKFNGASPLFMAAQKNMANVVVEMIKRPDIINEPNDHGRTPMDIAAREGSWDAVRVLLASPELRLEADNASHVLLQAMRGDQTDIALAVLRSKFSIDTAVTLDMNKSFRTALYQAVDYGNEELIKEILKRNPDQRDINRSFMYAMENKKYHVIETLIASNRVNLDMKFAGGNTYMLLAVKHGDRKLLKYLIKHNASCVITDANGHSAFSLAVQHAPKTAKLFYDLIARQSAVMNDTDKLYIMKTLMKFGKVDEAQALINVLYPKDNVTSINAVEEASGNTLLHMACMISKSMVEKILELHPDPNIVNQAGMTPLHHAIEDSSIEMVNLLLQQGAKVNPEFKDKIYTQYQSPLFTAFLYHDWEIVNRLLEEPGINVNVLDRNLNSPLLLACQIGHASIVEKLLKAGASLQLPTDVPDYKHPLYAAVDKDNTAVVTLLGRNGADPNQIFNGTSLLAIAGFNSRWETVEALMKIPGIEIDPVIPQEVSSHRHFSFLECLAMHGKTDLLMTIIRDPAITLSQQTLHGVLSQLVFAENTNLVRFVLDARKFDINSLDSRGLALIHDAAASGDDDLFRTLVDYGANPLLLSADPHNPDNAKSVIQFAAENSHWELVKRLLDTPGMPIERKGRMGDTLLHDACREGQVDIVNMIFDKFDINLLNDYAETPLNLAMKNNHPEVVRLIIEKGVDINLKNHEPGPTAIDDAINKRRWPIVDVLLDASAINPAVKPAVFHSGKALFLAVRDNQDEIAKKIMVREDLDPRFTDKKGKSILNVMIADAKNDLIHDFLKFKNIYNILNKPDMDGTTVATQAVLMGNWEIVAAIVKHPEYEISYDEKSTITLLSACVSNNRNDIIETIFENDPPPDYLLEKAFDAALSYVTDMDLCGLVDYLLKNGVNVDDAELGGTPLIHVAIENDRDDLLRILLNNGASLDVRNEYGIRALDIKSDSVKIKELLRPYQLQELKQIDETPIMQAAIAKNWQKVVELLNSDDSVNFPPKIYNRLICCASEDCAGNAEVINILKRQIIAFSKIDVEESLDGTIHNSPLVRAAAQNNQDLVFWLIDNDKDVSWKLYTPVLMTAMNSAAKAEHWELVEKLLKFAINADPFYRGNLYNEMLFDAAAKGQTELVKLLIKHVCCSAFDSPGNICDSNGKNVLHLAAEHGQLPLVELLLRSFHQDQEDANHQIPMTYAVKNDHWDVVDTMIKSGRLEVNYDEKGIQNLLFALVEKGKEDILINILNKYPVARYSSGYNGSYFLRVCNQAALENSPNLNKYISILLQQNPSHANDSTKNGFTALHAVAAGNNVELAKMLIESGANPEAKTKHEVPLNFALNAGHWDMASYLLKHTNHIRCFSKSVAVALDRALSQGRLDFVNDFFAKFPPAAIKSKENYTMLHVAVDMDCEDLARHLVKIGLPTDVVSNKGERPIDMLRGKTSDPAFQERKRQYQEFLAEPKHTISGAPHATMFGGHAKPKAEQQPQMEEKKTGPEYK